MERSGLRSSMSGKGNCFDNAPMESFWGTLKQELVHHRHYRSRQEAIRDITEYIEIFYNRQRRQARLGFLSPAAFHQRFYPHRQDYSQLERFGVHYCHPTPDCEAAKLRSGNVHSADDWQEVLDPVVERYLIAAVRLLFRADAAFAKPEIYEYLEARSIGYAIRLRSNQVLQREIAHLLVRPTEWPSPKPIVSYHDFVYQAQSWNVSRRVVAKVEWHQGELFPRVGFIVTNLTYPTIGIVRFYNGRGTAEQWIKEGKYALNWTRLSCHKFVANQVRLGLFVMAYNLGNFLRRLAVPEEMKHWSLTSLQTRMIKTGGRLVRHARRLVFQLAEVLVSREMLGGILERIGRLRLAPG